jgi:L-ribulose-5-phosphate 3-epimerase
MIKNKSKIPRIGFMQGRLSPVVENKIQAFPWKHWEDEFSSANSLDLRIMEWTLDQENLYSNPIMNQEGRDRIKILSRQFNISIPSLTGDCFMQAPFWKFQGQEKETLEKIFLSVLESCQFLAMEFIVVPLVDGGSIKTKKERSSLFSFFERYESEIEKTSIKILFESDYGPLDLKSFIDELNPKVFGINYDIGNSAAMGFDPEDEFSAYGNRIMNVHVKDRELNGFTVPLGKGDANFPLVFKLLEEFSYKGNYILQTARSETGDHLGCIREFKEKTLGWLC